MTAIAKPENRYLFEKSALLKILKDSRASARDKLEAVKLLAFFKLQTDEEHARLATMFGRRFAPAQESAQEEESTSPQVQLKPELPEHLK